MVLLGMVAMVVVGAVIGFVSVSRLQEATTTAVDEQSLIPESEEMQGIIYSGVYRNSQGDEVMLMAEDGWIGVTLSDGQIYRGSWLRSGDVINASLTELNEVVLEVPVEVVFQKTVSEELTLVEAGGGVVVGDGRFLVKEDFGGQEE